MAMTTGHPLACASASAAAMTWRATSSEMGGPYFGGRDEVGLGEGVVSSCFMKGSLPLPVAPYHGDVRVGASQKRDENHVGKMARTEARFPEETGEKARREAYSGEHVGS